VFRLAFLDHDGIERWLNQFGLRHVNGYS
jgi:hypothetical protein